MTGLRARGGCTINMKLEKGLLTSAEISHSDGGVMQYLINGKTQEIVVPKGVQKLRYVFYFVKNFRKYPLKLS